MTPAELLSAIEEAGEQYARLVEAMSADDFRRPRGDGEWTVAEVTGHVAESPATIAGWAKRIVERPGAAFGRSLDDPDRLAAVASLADGSPAAAAAAVRDCVRRAVATLRALPDEGWQAKGAHARFGEFAVAGIVERFILQHLREHIEQVGAGT